MTSSAPRPLRSRWYGGFAWWASADPRALSVFRIMLGLLALWDVCRRVPWIELFLTNNGVNPNHFSLFRPHATYTFSLLHAFKTPAEVGLFFALTVVCLVLFTVGYRTRLFQALSALAMLSIHNRTIITENGGDVVMNLWWVWTFFLPLGRRYSVDALLASLKWRQEKRPEALNAPLPRDTRPVWHFAVFAVIWQLVLIYFFNTVHKSGPTWKDGSALAWVYEQDRIATSLALFLKDSAPLWLSKALTWGTLVIEGTAPILLLSPLFTTWSRRITLSLLTSLHLGIYLVTDVGLFSPVMVVAYFILLTPPDFALAARALTRVAGRPIRVFYDSDCGICHLTARVLRRMDVLERITWIGREGTLVPTGWTAEQLASAREDSLIVDDGQRVRTGARAVVRTLAALPLVRLVAWVGYLPGVHHLLDLAYGAFARRRHTFSASIGLGQCGLGGPAPAEDEVGQPPEPTRARRQLGRAGWALAHVPLLTIFLATQSQALIENRWLSKRIAHKQPAWCAQIVQYGRLFQGWGMFAPDAPRSDGHLVMDVELTDGRRLDPQTGRFPEFGPADAHTRRWDQFWGSFSMRIVSGRNTQLRDFFRDWLLRPTHRLSLGPGDRIKRMKIWWIGDHSPAPGSGGEPVVYERYVVLQHPPGAWDFDPPSPTPIAPR
jgi:predicted DCC family thiol-disulfide oxidoreductase YuxK